MVIVLLVVTAVNPIKDIQSAVRSEEKYIMTVKIFNLAETLQDYKLWYDRNSFEVNREGPENFDDVEALSHKHGQYR